MLQFTYVVQAADMDDNGIYIEENELVLNNGTIQGVDNDVAANLDYARLGAQSGHKVDGSLSTTPNSDPAFSQESTTREVPENSAAGTEVGDPLTATDDDNDTLAYTLEGADAASFQIVSTSGQIRTRSGVTYDPRDQVELLGDRHGRRQQGRHRQDHGDHPSHRRERAAPGARCAHGLRRRR